LCATAAGCQILDLEKISQYFVSPGGTTEQCALYCGRVDSEGVGGIFGLEHEFEDIRTEAVSLEKARAWLENGTINSAASIIALQWLLLNRDRLRRKWQ
jgi:ADP-ribose pyrophosphatase